jgi:CubicO group peptidase (beta-lactamase class C family)
VVTVRKIAGLLLFLLISPGGLAQEDPDPDAELRSKADEVFAEWDNAESPGCAMAAIRDGEIIHARGYGMANLEHGLPLTPRSVFRIGSSSKQFTAMAVLLLVEEGKLSLDDDIRKYLPELHEFDPPPTVRQLMHHTSGVRDYLTLMYLAGYRDEDYYTDAEVIEMLARQAHVNFKPGTQHLYSNSGYFLLSQIVLRASGKTLAEYAAERIFGPLGMKSTHYHDDHTRIVPNRASGYAPDGEGGYVISMTTLPMIGDGGVFTTVEDLLLWDRNFYDNKLGKGGPELIERMITTGALTNGDPLKYAAGLVVGEYRGLPMIGHGGAFVGFRADMIRFPEQRFSVAVLCNVAASNPSGLAKKVADAYLADLLEPEPELPQAPAPKTKPGEPAPNVKIDPALYDDYVGQYRLMPGFLLTVSREEDRLMVQPTGQAKTELFSESETLFVVKIADAKLEFKRDDSGKTTAVILYQAGRELRGERLDFEPPAEVTLRGYAGEYFSVELDVTYRISLEEDSLILHVRRLPPMTMQPSGTDSLGCDLGSLQFKRDAEGAIVGFELEAGRVRDLSFVRR